MQFEPLCGCMELDAEVDSAYPERWIGKVNIQMQDGRHIEGRVDEPKGDPGKTLSRAELEDKALRLAGYRNGVSESEMRAVIEQTWAMEATLVVNELLRARPVP